MEIENPVDNSLGAISTLPVSNLTHSLPVDFETKNGEVGSRLVLVNSSNNDVDSSKKNGYTSFGVDTTNLKEYAYDQPR